MGSDVENKRESDHVFMGRYINADLTKGWMGVCLADSQTHAIDIFSFRKEPGMILIEESVKFVGTLTDVSEDSRKQLCKTGIDSFTEFDLMIYNKGK